MFVPTTLGDFKFVDLVATTVANSGYSLIFHDSLDLKTEKVPSMSPGPGNLTGGSLTLEDCKGHIAVSWPRQLGK